VEHDLVTKVLVTGAGGQLGQALVRSFGDHVEVIAADHASLDVGDRDECVGAITALRPDVVVHTACWTNVDACESDPDRAYRVNGLGTRHVADGARRVGAHVVYISTDYVFDGRTDRAYVEWDTCNPLSVYGRSKRAGELEIDPGSTIVRTTWVFSKTVGLVQAIVRLAKGDGELRFVDDQLACPTYAEDLAAMVRDLATARLPGIFHVTNQGATTPLDLARETVRLAGEDPARVVAVSSVELGRPAPRPARSDLDNAALRLSGIPLLPDHHEPLERLVKELTSS
jgi:dTDP-4-dehydrorhamnose reductase